MASHRFYFAKFSVRNQWAEIVNNLIFESAQVSHGGVFGIDVTKPELLRRCEAGAINLKYDEQRGVLRSAIQDALIVELPPHGTTLASVRLDMDAVGAMAVMSLRAKCADLRIAEERIAMVADVDKFLRGLRSDPRLLPADDERLYDPVLAEVYPHLADIITAVADFLTLPSDRVGIMAHWLMSGEAPKQ